MPIYEYVCEECAKEFSQLLYSEADLKDLACPQCGSKKFHKLMSASTVGVASAKSSSTQSSGGGSCCAGGSCGCGF